MARVSASFPVEGLVCGTCAAAVQKKLIEEPGVLDAAVNFATGRATVTFDEQQVQVSRLIKALREAGYDSAKATVSFEIENMFYSTGASRVERELAKVPGVIRAVANQATARVTVEYLPGLVTVSELEDEIRSAGLAISPPSSREDAAKRRLKKSRSTALKFTTAAFLTLVTLVGSLPLAADRTVAGLTLTGNLGPVLDELFRSLLPQLYQLDPRLLRIGLLGLTLPTVLWCGREFFAHALGGLKCRTADPATLVAWGIGAVFVYSLVATVIPFAAPELAPAAGVYFDAVNGAVAVLLLGRWLDSGSKGILGCFLGRLHDLLPELARVQREGVDTQVPVQDVLVGDRVIVQPGETVPVDGVVLEGSSTVDESALSGVGKTAKKEPGHRIFAGSLNQSGSLVIRAEAVRQDTVLAQMVRLLEEAQLGKTRRQRLIEKIAVFVPPFVIAVSLGAFAAWFALADSAAVLLATLALASVSLIACPWVLSLAAPAAVLAGSGRGAEYGILIRGSETMEALKKVDTFVFHRTGAITEGKPAITHVLGAKKSDGSVVGAADLLRLAASVEARSKHPLARAVVEAARAKGIEPLPVERYVEMPGRGVRGIVGKYLVEVISVRHARERSLDLGALASEADSHMLKGRSSVVVVVNDTVQGLIVVADPLKSGAKQAIARLKQMGYRLYLLSGETRQAATLAAKEVGLEHVIAEVAPDDKVEEIRRLRNEGRVVAVVGHGREDALSLWEADVGFAIGAVGEPEVAAAQVTLLREDLAAVPAAMELSRRTIAAGRNGVLAAAAYHLLAIPLAAGLFYPWSGFVLGPVLAAAAASLAGWAVARMSLSVSNFRPSTGMS
ncbi:Copper-transporting P-type ATPase [bacterium HR33]|nr:Copper-transporting P-type ATPase [bacterium HR33]